MTFEEQIASLRENAQYADMAKLYYRAYKKSKNDIFAIQAGEAFLLAKQEENALRAYEELIGCGNEESYEKLLDFYFRIGAYTNASSAFPYLYATPSYSQLLGFGNRLFNVKAYKKAARWYEECFALPKEDLHYLKPIGCLSPDINDEMKKTLQKGDSFYRIGKYKSAIPYYLLYAKISDYAAFKLAECYFLLQEYDKAKGVYRELAQDINDGYAMFMLGECYCYDLSNKHAYEHAVYWYEYSLLNDCNYALYPLGVCYQFGYGVNTDLEKAISLFSKGATEGADRGACYCKLGNFAYEQAEYEKAKNYYLQGAAFQDARALLNLAIGYFNRKFGGIKRDQAICFLAKSAALGNNRAEALYEELKD